MEKHGKRLTENKKEEEQRYEKTNQKNPRTITGSNYGA